MRPSQVGAGRFVLITKDLIGFVLLAPGQHASPPRFILHYVSGCPSWVFLPSCPSLSLGTRTRRGLPGQEAASFPGPRDRRMAGEGQRDGLPWAGV